MNNKSYGNVIYPLHGLRNGDIIKRNKITLSTRGEKCAHSELRDALFIPEGKELYGQLERAALPENR